MKIRSLLACSLVFVLTVSGVQPVGAQEDDAPSATAQGTLTERLSEAEQQLDVVEAQLTDAKSDAKNKGQIRRLEVQVRNAQARVDRLSEKVELVGQRFVHKHAKAELKSVLRQDHKKASREFLETASDSGSFIDAASVGLLESPSGQLIIFDTDLEIEEVVAEASYAEVDGDLALDSDFGVSALPPDEELQERFAVPIGAGSNTRFMRLQHSLQVELRGHSNENSAFYENRIVSSLEYSYVDDTNQPGRRDFFVYDGDGSRYRDYYLIEYQATAFPNQEPFLDYAVLDFSIETRPSRAVANSRSPRLTDWEPLADSCSSEANLTVGAIVGVEIPFLCTSGYSIDEFELDGTYTLAIDCSICPGGSRGLQKALSINVRQAQYTPRFVHFSRARFRQAFVETQSLVSPVNPWG